MKKCAINTDDIKKIKTIQNNLKNQNWTKDDFRLPVKQNQFFKNTMKTNCYFAKSDEFVQKEDFVLVLQFYFWWHDNKSLINLKDFETIKPAV